MYTDPAIEPDFPTFDTTRQRLSLLLYRTVADIDVFETCTFHDAQLSESHFRMVG